MRGIGHPRALSALAGLPQRGLRGCPVLGPAEGAFRRGIGSAPAGGGRGRGRGAGAPAGGRSGDDEGENGRQEQARSGDAQGAQPGPPPGAWLGRGRGAPVPLPRPPVGEKRAPAPLPPPPFHFGRAGGVGRGATFPPPAPIADDSRDGGASPAAATASPRHEEAGPDPHRGDARAAPEPKPSAAEALLAKLGGPEPPPGPSAPPKIVPFRMPFARRPAEEQGPPQPAASGAPEAAARVAPPPMPLPSLSRGRGYPEKEDRVPPPESARTENARRQLGVLGSADSRPPRPRRPGQDQRPSVPRVQLSGDEASARAMAILQQGIEKSEAAESERRRNAGMDQFADATELLASRFRRSPEGPSAAPQARRPRERQRQRAGTRRSPHRRDVEDEMAAGEKYAMAEKLTPEQEQQLLQLQEEDTLKDRLHTLFLTQFEPEFAMEEFGRNPDIDEPPVLSLEEYLRAQRPFFLHEGSEISDEQQWNEAVAASLAQAPKLEKLVEAYSGSGRITARQQIAKLQSIHDQLPPSVSPEASAFTQRALLTLQNNPRLRLQQKERLMMNIVSGFSSS